MTLDHFLLGRYIVELYAATTLETRFRVYDKYVKELGFEGVAYTFAPRAHWEVFTQMPAIFLHSDIFMINRAKLIFVHAKNCLFFPFHQNRLFTLFL